VFLRRQQNNLFLKNTIDNPSYTCDAIESTTHLYYTVIYIVQLDNNLHVHYSSLFLNVLAQIYYCLIAILCLLTKTLCYSLMFNHVFFKAGDLCRFGKSIFRVYFAYICSFRLKLACDISALMFYKCFLCMFLWIYC
jgi:hypothetical protein